jgi:glycosyltransferase involved in cell wall biosynthesis
MVPFSSTAAQVILLIPAYKPAQILPSLVKSVLAMKEHPICGVLIVNDGSGPLYEPIFQELRESGRVEILTHACNLGKGAALKTGLNAALVKWPDAVGVVTADADGQHATTDIITVAQELARFPDALILGVRSFRSGTPFRSLFGNSLTRQVFRLATGKSITDTQTGLRGWPRTACLSALTVPINGYDFELECLLRTTHELREVPIETIYIENNKLSHFNPILDSMKIYFVFLRYCGSAVIAAILRSFTE